MRDERGRARLQLDLVSHVRNRIDVAQVSADPLRAASMAIARIDRWPSIEPSRDRP